MGPNQFISKGALETLLFNAHTKYIEKLSSEMLGIYDCQAPIAYDPLGASLPPFPKLTARELLHAEGMYEIRRLGCMPQQQVDALVREVW